MCKSCSLNPYEKVFYRPIEAAIRWSALSRFEERILKTLGDNPVPSPAEFPRWPMLRLSAERIFDALVNGELPYGKRGITCTDPAVLETSDLTIRHIDLRAWMMQYYPNQKPVFLFDDIERQRHPSISIEVVQTLLAEREAWRARCSTCSLDFETLNTEYQALIQAHTNLLAQTQEPHTLSQRGESTYLNIIGGLLTLLLGHSPSGIAYSTFKTQEAIISALIAHHGERMGIAERTLETKFAAAKRQFL